MHCLENIVPLTTSHSSGIEQNALVKNIPKLTVSRGGVNVEGISVFEKVAMEIISSRNAYICMRPRSYEFARLICRVAFYYQSKQKVFSNVTFCVR